LKLPKAVREYLKDINFNTLKKTDLEKEILKHILILLILMIYVIAKGIIKIAKTFMAFSIQARYGILKTCKHCVYSKTKETIILISGEGYNRDNNVLIILTPKNIYARRSRCLGYLKCGKCLEIIKGKCLNLPCKFIKL